MIFDSVNYGIRGEKQITKEDEGFVRQHSKFHVCFSPSYILFTDIKIDSGEKLTTVSASLLAYRTTNAMLLPYITLAGGN